MHYKRDYFLYSGGIHAKVGTLICNERSRDSGHAIQSLVYVVLKTADEIVPALEIELSKTQINEKTMLWKTGIALVKS